MDRLLDWYRLQVLASHLLLLYPLHCPPQVRDHPLYHLIRARIFRKQGDIAEASKTLQLAMTLPGIKTAGKVYDGVNSGHDCPGCFSVSTSWCSIITKCAASVDRLSNTLKNNVTHARMHACKHARTHARTHTASIFFRSISINIITGWVPLQHITSRLIHKYNNIPYD